MSDGHGAQIWFPGQADMGAPIRFSGQMDIGLQFGFQVRWTRGSFSVSRSHGIGLKFGFLLGFSLKFFF